jgi:hypothetical protein
VNESVENKAGDIVGDLVVYDDLEKNDASTSIEQEYQGDIGASDNADIDSDEQINVENQASNVQKESIFADSLEMKDTPTFNVLMIVRKSIQLIRQLMQMVILVKILIIQKMQRI